MLVYCSVCAATMCITSLLAIRGGNLLAFCIFFFGFFMIVGLIVRTIDLYRKDLLFGYYTFDDEKLVFQCPTHTTVFQYDECAEAGFTRVRARAFEMGSPYAQFVYYIYLSKRKLTDAQRSGLLQYHRTELHKHQRKQEDIPVFESEYVLFQYTPEAYEEFKKCIPERIRNELEEAEKSVVLTRYEERMSRDESSIDGNKDKQRSQPEWYHESDTITSQALLRRTSVDVPRKDTFKASETVRGMSRVRRMFTGVWWFGIIVDMLLGTYSIEQYTLFGKILIVSLYVWGIYSNFILLYNEVTQPLLGRVFFSEEGVYYKMPFRTMKVRFDECKNIRIIRWKGKYAVIHFICMSSGAIPDVKDKHLYRITKNKKHDKPEYMKDYVLFEYKTGPYGRDKSKAFEEFMKYVPEQYKEQLLQDEKELVIPFLNSTKEFKL